MIHNMTKAFSTRKMAIDGKTDKSMSEGNAWLMSINLKYCTLCHK